MSCPAGIPVALAGKNKGYPVSVSLQIRAGHDTLRGERSRRDDHDLAAVVMAPEHAVSRQTGTRQT